MYTFEEFAEKDYNRIYESKGGEEIVSDKSGPCKGKPFNKIGSEGHIEAMNYHSDKYNEMKKAPGTEYIKKAGIDYHTKMYQAHKKAISK